MTNDDEKRYIFALSNLRQQRVVVQEAIELDELEGIVQPVARGLGVGLSPRTLAAAQWPPGVMALPLGADTFYREVGLVERAPHSRQPVASRLAERIAEAARALAGLPLLSQRRPVIRSHGTARTVGTRLRKALSASPCRSAWRAS